MDIEILNEKKRDREDKPEALASPESVSKKKKRKMKEQQNQQPSEVFPKPLVVATPITVECNLHDPKDTPKRKKRGKKKKKGKSYLNGEQQELNKKKENGEVPNEINAQLCPLKPLLVPPISVEANLVELKDTPKKKKKKKNKNKSELNGEQQELEMKTEALDHDQKQTEPHASILVSLIPQTSTLQPAIPIDTEQNLSKSEKKRKKKKRRGMLDGVQPNENNIETPAPKICPEPAPQIGQTIPVDPAISMDEPAPQIGQTIPVNKNKRKKKKRMLDGAQPNGHDANSTAEALVRETIRVTVTKDPSYWHNQRSQICWACRNSDHKISQCRMLKSLSQHQEVCFFCGEIGHSLGRCSVSSAGGGRLAKCLLCHADGHFSYNCPGDGHGNYLKQREARRGVHC